VTVPTERGSLPLTLPGRFTPYAIQVGHGKFLLRGFQDDGDDNLAEDQRIFDVLFQDVSRISVADWYTGLTLTVADPDLRRSEERRVGADWGSSRMFLVGPAGTDYVVAGHLYWAQVLVHGGAPSPLLDENLTQDAVAGAIRQL